MVLMPWTCLRHGKYGALARLVAGRWAPHHEAPSQAAPLVVCFLAQMLWTTAAAAGCCCRLLRAAAGCCWFRCWCCYFCLLFSRTRRVRTLPQLAWWDEVFIPPSLHYHFYTTTFSSSTKFVVPGPQQFYQCARAFYSYLLRGG